MIEQVHFLLNLNQYDYINKCTQIFNRLEGIIFTYQNVIIMSLSLYLQLIVQSNVCSLYILIHSMLQKSELQRTGIPQTSSEYNQKNKRVFRYERNKQQLISQLLQVYANKYPLADINEEEKKSKVNGPTLIMTSDGRKSNEVLSDFIIKTSPFVDPSCSKQYFQSHINQKQENMVNFQSENRTKSPRVNITPEPRQNCKLSQYFSNKPSNLINPISKKDVSSSALSKHENKIDIRQKNSDSDKKLLMIQRSTQTHKITSDFSIKPPVLFDKVGIKDVGNFVLNKKQEIKTSLESNNKEACPITAVAPEIVGIPELPQSLMNIPQNKQSSFFSSVSSEEVIDSTPKQQQNIIIKGARVTVSPESRAAHQLPQHIPQHSSQSSQNSFLREKKYIDHQGFRNGKQSKEFLLIFRQLHQTYKKKQNLKEESQKAEQTKQQIIHKIIPHENTDKLQSENIQSVVTEYKQDKQFGNSVLKKQQVVSLQQNVHTNSVNLSKDFFAKSHNSIDIIDELSVPSTVNKVESHSVNQSGFLNQLNLQEMKDDSVIITNLFNKTQPQAKFQREEEESQQEQKQSVEYQRQEEVDETIEKGKEQPQGQDEGDELQQKEEAQQSESRIVSMQLSSSKHPNQPIKPKQININLSDLQSIYLSEDAVSFSKLQNSNQNTQIFDPTLNSFKESRAIQPEQGKQIQQFQPILSEKASIVSPNVSSKKGKVKKIDINLIQESSEEQSLESIEDDDDEVDMTQLSSYDSDEEEPSNPARISTHSKDNHYSQLFPVMEEEMQESEFVKKQQKIKPLFKKIALKKQCSDVKLKQLQSQFLKDFQMDKKQSEVESYKVANKLECNEERKPIVKIKMKPTESKIVAISEQKIKSNIVDQSSDEEKMEERLELVSNLKGDIQRLKSKISLNLNIDNNEMSNLSGNKTSSKEGKKINIDLSSDLSIFDKSYSRDIPNIKISRQESRKDSVAETAKKINFELINEGSSDNIFSSFRQDLNSLKKKMQDDAVNFV